MVNGILMILKVFVYYASLGPPFRSIDSFNIQLVSACVPFVSSKIAMLDSA